MEKHGRKGDISWISGSVVAAHGINDVEMGEIVEVGEEGLIGEVIRIKDEEFIVEIYENTSGLKPGEPVIASGKRLVAELGPGLLNNILDGIGRPLEAILKQKGPFITRGVKISTLPRNKKWHFKPTAMVGGLVEGGDIIGTTKETNMIDHKITVPPETNGKIVALEEGDFTVDDPIGKLETVSGIVPLRMMQEWPVRLPRPFQARLASDEPLVTGQRVIDVFFPISKGGTAAIPGGFGTGKTVMLHQLARWSNTQVVVYIGCGERGNEMCEVATDFPKLKDPRTGYPLMERTFLLANTSNMPVAAREASIYYGITVAEYYRDQGYDVSIMADSTSRWAEALREVSGRLEEMPVESGYPAYLPDRVAEFYERAGRVRTLGKPQRDGSVTVIGAVSPPGGDFNEPVTIHTLRFTGVFWALDADLAYSRHFPAIQWLKSYSLYANRLLSAWAQSFSDYSGQLQSWWKDFHQLFPELRDKALAVLNESSEIESIAKIIGENALPDDQRLILLTADTLKEGFLRQFAFDKVDSFCEPEKQFLLLKMMTDFHDQASVLIKNRVPIIKISSLPELQKMKRIKQDEGGIAAIRQLMEQCHKELRRIGEEYRVSSGV
ncbi:V-type ATP synthase subunit A [Candidatus Bathyarchaeota archaeon RBG_16_48_13]|nr:MAG: V-type ATP synthase subunit A [Candidatus Bathyarchaeota archaeon RBG_16_48_13]